MRHPLSKLLPRLLLWVAIAGALLAQSCHKGPKGPEVDPVDNRLLWDKGTWDAKVWN